MMILPRNPMIACIGLILAGLCLPCAASPAGYLKKPDDWFASPEGRKTSACILSWQSEHGSWPKNQDTTRSEFSGDRSRIKGTFDNGATTDELRFLGRAFRATGDQRCLAALHKGIDHLLEAQYPNGGWPQYFPLSSGYHRHITYNDGSMIRVMEFLREVATSDGFKFIDAERRKAAGKAFDRGVGCIVKTQIIVRGTPTVWCAQHDEITLAPAPARSYELASLSGSESAGILRLLMSLEDPPPDVVRAVKAGAAWFESSKLVGIRLEKSDGDRRIVKDASAPPLWARFYEIETNRPFFCDRDGVKKSALAEIGVERRNGYAWYGNWGIAVAKAFGRWPHR